MELPPHVKSSLLGATAFAVAFTCLGGEHRAAATPIASTTLGVAASVNISCTIAGVPVVFGNYDPNGVNATAPLDAAGGVSVNCTVNGGNVRVALGEGLYPAAGSNKNNPLRQMANGASRLSYGLYTDAARTSVWNNNNGVKTGKNFPQLMTVYGRIPAAQIVPSGAYADSILATVTF